MKGLNPNLYKKYVEETSDDIFPSTVSFSPQHQKLVSKEKWNEEEVEE